MDNEPGGPSDVEGNSAAGTNATGLSSGWPAPPNRTDDADVELAEWRPGAAVASQAEPDIEKASEEGWGGGVGTTWPSAAMATRDEPGSDGAPRQQADAFWRGGGAGPGTPSGYVTGSDHPVPASIRANTLLDELRHVIAMMGEQPRFDLAGVVSDLEVAVTPPGALAPDDLSELREALLRARERPRDLDTVVDLSKRVDAVVALMFAYDRAVAAIERSLAVLRRDVPSQPIPADSSGLPSPVDSPGNADS